MKHAQGDWGRVIEEQARRHGRLLFGVAQRILRDAAAAEDACQQALLKAWQQEAAVRDRMNLRPWLTRVVINESLQQLRKRRRERAALDGQAAIMNETTVAPGDGLAVRETVRLALDELPEPTRSVVVLRLMGGYSGNEVKAMLGCSASEVSRRLHTGMEQLRERLMRQECER